MNRLMNCDHVFDILTRAPFPTGDDTDPDVEHHLRACHGCRQLAEALRPAVDLFHESISPDECNSFSITICKVHQPLSGLPRGSRPSIRASNLASNLLRVKSRPNRSLQIAIIRDEEWSLCSSGPLLTVVEEVS